jgi:hypothetical protein
MAKNFQKSSLSQENLYGGRERERERKRERERERVLFESFSNKLQTLRLNIKSTSDIKMLLFWILNAFLANFQGKI